MSVTAAVNTPRRDVILLPGLPVEAGTTIYVGSLTSINAAGNIIPAADAAGQAVLGRFNGVDETTLTPDLIVGSDAVNAGSAGAITGSVERGGFEFANSSGNPVTLAMVGQPCYVQDAATVSDFAGSTHKIVAGVVIGLSPDGTVVHVDTLGRRAVGLAPTSDAITDSSGGTGASISDGAVTVAAIVAATTDTSAAKLTTTQNAIATLIAQIKLIQADIATLFNLLS